MAKKKISFDIEKEDFEKLKIASSDKQMGQGQFLRYALKEILEKDNDYFTIYIPINFEIKSFVIRKNDFEFISFAPFEDVKNFGAKLSGDLLVKKENKNKELDEIMLKYGKIRFFTMEKI